MTIAKVDTAEYKDTQIHQVGTGAGGNERVLPNLSLPVTITTPEGETFEIADDPLAPGKSTAFAGEATLCKLWGKA